MSKYLKKVLEEKHISQAELGRRLGLKRNTINWYCNNKEHIAEEIADCLLLIKQFRDFYKIQDEEIREVYDYKIARQERRIADEIQHKL